MKIEQQQLVAFLTDSGLIEKDKLEAAVKKAESEDKKLEVVLLDEKIVSEENLIKLKAYILGIPFVSLEKETVPAEVLQIIPEPIARRYSIVAFRKKGSDLEVAMTDPEDIQTIEFIRKKSNLRILPRLTNSASISGILKQYQKSIEEEFGDLFAHTKEDEESVDKEARELGSLEGKIVTAPKDDDASAAGQKPEDLAKAAEDLPVI